ncbi:ABC transporter permease [Streptomyces sp. NPDC002994]|uniref:ABC transporter permease n=1 Tax=Streptomyces sp. NPDC002994 TaxID=3154441 RepID=UPI0033B866A5
MTNIVKAEAGTVSEPTANLLAGGSGESEIKPAKQWRDIRKRFVANKLAVVGLALVCLLFLTAIFAPLIAPYDPYEQDLMNTLSPPTAQNIAGTDSLGRDVFSRVIYGSRIAVIVGLASMFLASFLGIIFGSLAGYFGNKTDSLIMRVADIFFAFPLLIGAIVIILLTGRGVFPVVLSLAIFGWATVARLLRSSILSTREADYVMAAKALGASTGRILMRHILPNSIAPVVVYATTSVASALVAAASLSFLGVGVSPETPEWGNMIAAARDFVGVQDVFWIAPSAGVVLACLGFIFVGDGLRDALDPKLR